MAGLPEERPTKSLAASLMSILRRWLVAGNFRCLRKPVVTLDSGCLRQSRDATQRPSFGIPGSDRLDLGR